MNREMCWGSEVRVHPVCQATPISQLRIKSDKRSPCPNISYCTIGSWVTEKLNHSARAIVWLQSAMEYIRVFGR